MVVRMLLFVLLLLLVGLLLFVLLLLLLMIVICLSVFVESLIEPSPRQMTEAWPKTKITCANPISQSALCSDLLLWI